MSIAASSFAILRPRHLDIPQSVSLNHLLRVSRFSRTLGPGLPVRQYSFAASPTIKTREYEENITATSSISAASETRQDWQLTVGIEIHAQLNTAAKLFSGMPIEYLLQLN